MFNWGRLAGAARRAVRTNPWDTGLVAAKAFSSGSPWRDGARAVNWGFHQGLTRMHNLAGAADVAAQHADDAYRAGEQFVHRLLGL